MTRFVLIAIVLATGCKIRNEESCDIPNNPLCPTGGDAAMACEDDTDCTAVDATRCNTDTGVCVQCVDNGTCSGNTPVCNTVDSSCEGCNAHSDCTGSNACDFGTGACLDAADIAYVTSGGATSGECPQETPCASIALALQTNKPNIRIIGTTPVVSAAKTVIDQDVTILADVGAVVRSTAADPMFEVVNDSVVTIRDLEIRSGLGPTGDAILISGSTVTLTLERVFLLENGGRGVTANSGTKLTMRGCVLAANGQGGIFLQGIDFDITNSIIVANGGAASIVGGLRVATPDQPSTVIFEFNTVADNDADAANTARAGVTCNDVFPARNNIVTGNALDDDCTFTHSLFDDGATVPAGDGNLETTDPMFGEIMLINARMASYYRLLTGSPAIDKADSSSAIKVDIDGQPRPQGAEKDMGADEVMP